MYLLNEIFPEVVVEIKSLLEKEGRRELVDQLASLSIVERCRCSDDSCGSFYLLPKPNSAWGPKHENVVLDGQKYDYVLDVVDGKIAFVEIKNNYEMNYTLRKLFP